MAWWNKLFGADSEPDDVDYYREGLELMRTGNYHEALTSFRLAQREAPDDTAVMQQIAIAYTRIGMTEEAARTYRGVLSREPDEPGAHYGLAFLLLSEGKSDEAAEHLRAFLEQPPGGGEAERHLAHARDTLAQIEAGGGNGAAGQGDLLGGAGGRTEG